jgi:Ser/Thr protein kinase RdoA (MazF antagonist)
MPLGSSLSTPPPTLSPDEAASLVGQHFGLTGPLSPLTSERDLNYRLTTPAGGYVVKLANPAEPAAVTRFQTLALIHLEGTTLPVPRMVRTLDGATEVATPHGILRLLTYLEGHPMHLTPRSLGQAAAMGRMAARLSLGLQGFSHPAADHVLQWDIKRAASLRPLLPFVSADLRPLATEVLDRFDRDLAPLLPGLRAQVVHNDLNPHNVLVDPADPAQITGVLDFGDMVQTPLICDAAVAASYQIDPAQAWQSLQTFAAAYHATLPLADEEARLLPDLTATRMLTTLAVASARAARYPDNAAYILRNVPAATAGLQALSAAPRIVLELS